MKNNDKKVLRLVILFLIAFFVFGIESDRSLLVVYAEESVQTDGENENDPPEDTVTVKERDWTKYNYRYSYNLLTDDEKAFYDDMYNVVIDILTTTKDVKYVKWLDQYQSEEIETANLSSSEKNKVIDLFLCENPQFYFIWNAIGSSSGSTKIYFLIDKTFADGEKRAEITNSIFDFIDNSAKQISEGKTKSSEIELGARNLICDMTDYEAVGFHQTIYSVFVGHKSVCKGYALSMSILMNAAGVPTVTVNGGSHAWNKVLLEDNKWYVVDVTWDDSNPYSYYNRSDEDIKYRDKSTEHVPYYPSYYPPADTTMTHIDLGDGRWADGKGGIHTDGESTPAPSPTDSKICLLTFTTSSGELLVKRSTIYYRADKGSSVKDTMDADRDDYRIIQVTPGSDDLQFVGYKVKGDPSGIVYICDIDFKDDPTNKKMNIYNYILNEDTIFEAYFENASENVSTPTPTPTASVKPTPSAVPTNIPDTASRPTPKKEPTNSPSGGYSKVQIGDVITEFGSIYIITGNNTAAYKECVIKNKKSITIPASIKVRGTIYKITEIKPNAFKGCKKLKKITIKTTKLKTVGKNAFKGINKKAVFRVPKKKYKKYKKLFKSKTGYKKTMKIKKK